MGVVIKSGLRPEGIFSLHIFPSVDGGGGGYVWRERLGSALGGWEVDVLFMLMLMLMLMMI